MWAGVGGRYFHAVEAMSDLQVLAISGFAGACFPWGGDMPVGTAFKVPCSHCNFNIRDSRGEWIRYQTLAVLHVWWAWLPRLYAKSV